MELVYIYHSGFAILGEGFTVIIDYYRDSAEKPLTGVVHAELLKRPGRLYVLVSHSHADHFNPEVLTWREKHPDIRYIFSLDVLRSGKASTRDARYLDQGGVWTDGSLEVEAFGSTDQGISFLIRVKRQLIFHAGDLNNWHWKEESTGDEVREAERAYFDALDEIARVTKRVDVVMFPVDPRQGEDYMLGAKQFVDKFKVGTFVPMHFDDAYDKANAFREYAESHGAKFVELTYKGEVFNLETRE